MKKKPEHFKHYTKLYANERCAAIEPDTFEEAMNSINKEDWIEAMKSEYDSLISMQTWEAVDLPMDRNAIKNKWVYKIKTDHKSKQPKFKARLVDKGYSQQHGIDYEETFSPVVESIPCPQVEL